jgi:hypothetical protein
MSSAGERAVYNRPIAEMQIRSSGHGSRAGSLLILILFCWSSTSSGAEWTTPAQELARKISAVTGPVSVAIHVTNRSLLSAKDVADIDRELRAQLLAAGVQPTKSEQATTVEVTVSENALSYVWVAEIRRNGVEPSVAMVSVPRRGTPVPAQDLPPMSLRKIPLWRQQTQILDVVVLEEAASPTRLAVLDPDAVTLYRSSNGQWREEQRFPITHSRTWPRDLRGRLWLRPDHGLDAYLPGAVCRTASGGMNGLICGESGDPWPLSTQVALAAFFAPTRNFFTGALAPGIGQRTSIAKFYSAALVVRPNTTQWVVAETDGSVHLIDGASDQTLHVTWGSDLAGVRSSCGSGSQILITQAGGGAGDSIRAYEVSDRDVAPVSSAMDVDGPITALWTEARSTSAIAVYKDATSEGYGAFRVALGCGQ